MKRSLRMSKEFKVGDKVRLKDQGRYMGTWCGVMEVSNVYIDEGVTALHPYNKLGYFREDELELIEEQPYAIPADFRFFRRTDGAISEVPYPTFEAALEGWRGFAQDGDQTEIVELIPHGTYKATLKVEVVEPITEGA
jgi:uncharacterized protein YodC (DUF2158 family)